ncbi:MAG: cobalamin-dependent protein [Candidatus Bathyarchaeia archaeon]
MPPLALAYIGAVLEREGHSVEIFDRVAFKWRTSVLVKEGGQNLRYYGPAEEESLHIVEKSAPELVGISCIASMYAREAHHTAKIVKMADKDIKVVLGEAHPMALPKETLRDPNVDYVVLGEGEMSTAELVNKLESEEISHQLMGLHLE